jgi:hypothetical protein
MQNNNINTIPEKVFEYSSVFQHRKTANPLNKHNVTTFFLEILTMPEKVIVILSELEENEGFSVTNSVEYLATDVYHKFLSEYYPEQIIWIEHYPERAYRSIKNQITFSRVTLGWFKDRKAFYHPQWEYIKSIEEVREIIK